MWQQLTLIAMCLLFVFGALGFAVWAVITGQIMKQGIDALFLLFICLLIALIFLPIPIQAMRKGLLQQLLKGSKTGAVKDQTVERKGAQDSQDDAKQQSA